jgi:cytochrome c553
VDVVEGPDGAIYVTDDYAGSVYRIDTQAAPTGAVPAHDSTAAAEPARTSAAALPISATEVAERSERGAALFEKNACHGCHVEGRLAPGVVGKPLANLSQRYTVDDLAAYLAAPTPPMPLFPLSGEERKDLAVYLLSSRP